MLDPLALSRQREGSHGCSGGASDDGGLFREIHRCPLRYLQMVLMMLPYLNLVPCRADRAATAFSEISCWEHRGQR